MTLWDLLFYSFALAGSVDMVFEAVIEDIGLLQNMHFATAVSP
jgi:hypothetical protein